MLFRSYIPRFAMILQVIWSSVDDNYEMLTINKSSVLQAEILSEYFINMSKMVKADMKEKNNIRQISAQASGIGPKDKFKAIYKNDPDFNRTHAAEILEISRQTVYRWIKEMEKNN